MSTKNNSSSNVSEPLDELSVAQKGAIESNQEDYPISPTFEAALNALDNGEAAQTGTPTVAPEGDAAAAAKNVPGGGSITVGCYSLRNLNNTKTEQSSPSCLDFRRMRGVTEEPQTPVSKKKKTKTKNTDGTLLKSYIDSSRDSPTPRGKGTPRTRGRAAGRGGKRGRGSSVPIQLRGNAESDDGASGVGAASHTMDPLGATSDERYLPRPTEPASVFMILKGQGVPADVLTFMEGNKHLYDMLEDLRHDGVTSTSILQVAQSLPVLKKLVDAYVAGFDIKTLRMTMGVFMATMESSTQMEDNQSAKADDNVFNTTVSGFKKTENEQTVQSANDNPFGSIVSSRTARPPPALPKRKPVQRQTSVIEEDANGEMVSKKLTVATAPNKTVKDDGTTEEFGPTKSGAHRDSKPVPTSSRSSDMEMNQQSESVEEKSSFDEIPPAAKPTADKLNTEAAKNIRDRPQATTSDAHRAWFGNLAVVKPTADEKINVIARTGKRPEATSSVAHQASIQPPGSSSMAPRPSLVFKHPVMETGMVKFPSAADLAPFLRDATIVQNENDAFGRFEESGSVAIPNDDRWGSDFGMGNDAEVGERSEDETSTFEGHTDTDVAEYRTEPEADKAELQSRRMSIGSSSSDFGLDAMGEKITEIDLFDVELQATPKQLCKDGEDWMVPDQEGDHSTRKPLTDEKDIEAQIPLVPKYIPENGRPENISQMFIHILNCFVYMARCTGIRVSTLLDRFEGAAVERQKISNAWNDYQAYFKAFPEEELGRLKTLGRTYHDPAEVPPKDVALAFKYFKRANPDNFVEILEAGVHSYRRGVVPTAEERTRVYDTKIRFMTDYAEMLSRVYDIDIALVVSGVHMDVDCSLTKVLETGASVGFFRTYCKGSPSQMVAYHRAHLYSKTTREECDNQFGITTGTVLTDDDDDNMIATRDSRENGKKRESLSDAVRLAILARATEAGMDFRDGAGKQVLVWKRLLTKLAQSSYAIHNYPDDIPLPWEDDPKAQSRGQASKGLQSLSDTMLASLHTAATEKNCDKCLKFVLVKDGDALIKGQVAVITTTKGKKHYYNRGSSTTTAKELIPKKEVEKAPARIHKKSSNSTKWTKEDKRFIVGSMQAEEDTEYHESGEEDERETGSNGLASEEDRKPMKTRSQRLQQVVSGSDLSSLGSEAESAESSEDDEPKMKQKLKREKGANMSKGDGEQKEREIGRTSAPTAPTSTYKEHTTSLGNRKHLQDRQSGSKTGPVEKKKRAVSEGPYEMHTTKKPKTVVDSAGSSGGTKRLAEDIGERPERLVKKLRFHSKLETIEDIQNAGQWMAFKKYCLCEEPGLKFPPTGTDFEELLSQFQK